MTGDQVQFFEPRLYEAPLIQVICHSDQRNAI